MVLRDPPGEAQGNYRGVPGIELRLTTYTANALLTVLTIRITRPTVLITLALFFGTFRSVH